MLYKLSAMFCHFANKLPYAFKTALAKHKTVLIAVSGGSDSLALLYFLKRYCQTYHPSIKLQAVTIDHRLRPESYKEACFVKDICHRLNVTHKILAWQGDKPHTRLLEEARFVRYQLLLQELSLYQKPILCTAHSLTDQAETYLMRQARSPHGGRGLTAMSNLSYLKNKDKLYPFWRPFLALTREQLKSYLIEENQNWISDPSNENNSFERIRIRQNLTLEQITLSVQAIKDAVQTRRKQNDHLKSLLDLCHITFAKGLLSLKIQQDSQSTELARLLSLLSAIIGGVGYFGGEKEINFFEKKLVNHSSKTNYTYHRALISQNKSQNFWQIHLCRENRHLPCSSLLPKEEILWDGRFWIKNHQNHIIKISKTSELLAEKIINHFKELAPLSYEASLTMPTISTAETSFLPFFEPKKTWYPMVSIDYNLAPFQWLICEWDFPLYHSLKNIFTIEKHC